MCLKVRIFNINKVWHAYTIRFVSGCGLDNTFAIFLQREMVWNTITEKCQSIDNVSVQGWGLQFCTEAFQKISPQWKCEKESESHAFSDSHHCPRTGAFMLEKEAKLPWSGTFEGSPTSSTITSISDNHLLLNLSALCEKWGSQWREPYLYAEANIV